MRFLLIICFNILLAGAFAHSDEHSLGDEADAIKAAGKTYHQSVSVIRKMHPEFLNHKRDKTLRQGVRNDENSLKGCVNCHATKNETTNTYHPVNKKDQFCSTCHQQVSVSVDCFGCHRTTPSETVINKQNAAIVSLPNTVVEALESIKSATIVNKEGVQ